MAENTRAVDLLTRWDELRDQGQVISAEELCRDCPELLPEVRRHLADRQGIEPVVEPSKFDTISGTALRPPATDELPPTKPTVSEQAKHAVEVPGYEILGELGRGGMGVVYKARHLRLNRIVALKMVLAGGHASAAALARFLSEAQAVAALQHPNIVQIHEIGEHQGLPYFTLEYMEAGSLAKLVRDQLLAPDEAAALVEQLARGMHFAHGRGIVHRDLKPDNVLLSSAGAASNPSFGGNSQTAAPRSRATAHQAKITDFGLAKRIEGGSGLTQSGAIIGTPSYMAPEQADGKARDVGPLADVYALGAILYRLLTGRPPFQAATAMDTVLQVLNDEPVTPSRLMPKTPRDLETICTKCLRKEPARRYASAESLAEDLRRYLDGEPIVARPVGRVERAAKWVQRNRGLAAALSAVAASLLLGSILSLTLAAIRAGQARTLAEERGEDVKKALNDALPILYRNGIALAEREWTNNNLKGAEEALESCPPELRCWEWHHLKRRCAGELRSYRGHEQEVTCVAYSSDGTRLVSGSDDHTVRIWDTGTGAQLQVLRGHSAPIAAVAFSPDGSRVASVTSSKALFDALKSEKPPVGELRIWDTKTGNEVLASVGFGEVSFSQDSRHITAVSSSSSVTTWDAASGREVLTFRGTGPATAVFHSAWHSPDGRYVAAATLDTQRLDAAGYSIPGTLTVWEASTGKEVLALPCVSAPSDAHFAQDGGRLVTGHMDGTVNLWEVPGGKKLLGFHPHQDAFTVSVALSRDGERLATTSDLGTFTKIWDATKGTELRALHGVVGKDLALSPDGRRLAVPSKGEKTLKEWDAHAGQGALRFPGQSGIINGVAFEPGGRHFAAVTTPLRVGNAATVNQLKIWDTLTGAEIASRPCGAIRLAFSPDGKLLATAGGDEAALDNPGELKLWDTSDWKETRTLKGAPKFICGVAFTADSRLLVSSSVNPMEPPQKPATILIHDVASGELHHQFQQPSAVFALAARPDSDTLAFACGDSTVKLWDHVANKQIANLEGHNAPVNCVAFSRDGRFLASGSVDGQVRLWDAASAQATHICSGHRGALVGLAFSADNRRLASADITSTRGEIKLWDVATGKEVFALPGLLTVAFSSDGHRLAAAVWDLHRGAELNLWDGTPAKDPP